MNRDIEAGENGRIDVQEHGKIGKYGYEGLGKQTPSNRPRCI